MLADGAGTPRKLTVKCRDRTSALTLQSGKRRHMHLTQRITPAAPAPLLARVRQGETPKGARGGRKEASEVAGPNREEDVGQAQATEEDLARQVVVSRGCLLRVSVRARK